MASSTIWTQFSKLSEATSRRPIHWRGEGWQNTIVLAKHIAITCSTLLYHLLNVFTFKCTLSVYWFHWFEPSPGLCPHGPNLAYMVRCSQAALGVHRLPWHLRLLNSWFPQAPGVLDYLLIQNWRYFEMYWIAEADPYEMTQLFTRIELWTLWREVIVNLPL